MKLKYISQIQSNMKKNKVFNTKKSSSRVLDGAYKSVFKGRSLNFDELREYVPGDDVKDISWKASARCQKLLVKEYVAERKHDVMFVFDTNKRMLADSADNEEKRYVAIMSAGTLAFRINLNGDYIGAMFGTCNSMEFINYRMGLENIEYMLEKYDANVSMENESSIVRTLEYIVRSFKRRMIVVVVTDLKGAYEISEVVIKRMLVMNDMMIYAIRDTDIYGKKVYGLENTAYLPDFLTRDKKLAKRQRQKQEQMIEACEKKFKKYGVQFKLLKGTKDIE